MNTASAMSDREFLDAFQDCRLTPADFDHRGHLRAAWLVLCNYPLEDAIERICEGIRRLATQFGAPEKYNRTLTEAIVRLMAAANVPQLSWTAFMDANPELATDLNGVLSRHYSQALLTSTAAKAAFLPPDRLPLRSCTTTRLAH
jgi:hypothetical protein